MGSARRGRTGSRQEGSHLRWNPFERLGLYDIRLLATASLACLERDVCQLCEKQGGLYLEGDGRRDALPGISCSHWVRM